MKRISLVLLIALLPTAAAAQIPDLSSLIPPGGGSASGRLIQLVALLTVLSLAPGLLIMVTSFTRFVVALSFLRAGLGLQTTPANIVMISLALFMTFYVMAPTFDRAWTNGVQPLMQNEISEQEAYSRVTDPFRDFMLAHVREKDLQTFESLAAEGFRTRFDDKRIDLRVNVRDRLFGHHAVSGDRHGRRHAYDVDGHDDDAANRVRSPVQGAVFRADRWLESPCSRPGAVVSLACSALGKL